MFARRPITLSVCSLVDVVSNDWSVLASLMKNTGILVANDINKERTKSLVANVHRLGKYINIAIFERVLIDVCCFEKKRCAKYNYMLL